MTGPDALATIAEIAIAIAGFSGIAAVLGRRTHGEWTPQDVFRLRSLLFSSFIVVVFSFVPIVLTLTSLPGPAVWRISSGAWLATLFLVLMVRGGEARRISQETGEIMDNRSLGFAALLVLSMLILHSANAVFLGEAWPYVAAAMCALVIPFLFFVWLLRAIMDTDPPQ